MTEDLADRGSFSRQAAIAILEHLEEATDGEFTYDAIAIRCDFSEYETALDAALEYDFNHDIEEQEEAIEAAALKFLEENTLVLTGNFGVIVQNF